MPTTDSPTKPGFWRCDRCGTPNPSSLYIASCIGCGARRPPPGFESRADVPRPPSRGTARSPGLMATVAGYGLVLVAALLLGRGIGDAWWPGLILSMSPRGLFLIPLVPLGVLAWRRRRPAIGVAILLEAVFILGPLMGFVIPWGRLGARADGPTIRIMTLNRGGIPMDATRFMNYLDRQKIDVLCFQEYEPDPALDRLLADRYWHRDSDLAIASRLPMVAELPRSMEINDTNLRYTATLYRARLAMPDGREFVVGSLHLPTFRYAFQKLFRGETSAMTPQIHWWSSEFGRMFNLFAGMEDTPILVGGDFNNGPDATSFSALRDSGMFKSAFDEAGLGWGYTRASSFPWVRIDHILASPHWAVKSCWSGPGFGSDHRSLVAEVALSAKP